jgi:catechol 2,3-dioxygenase-like lactoylglutathione lyase family enzyme
MGKVSRILMAGALGLACVAGGAARADIGPNTAITTGGMVFANVSISVADLDKSVKFYQALGFEAGDAHALPGPVAKVLGAKAADAKLEIRFLKRDGITLELVHFTPAPAGKASAGSASAVGLCHIAFRVDDVDRVAKIVKENGGKTEDAARTKLGAGPQGIDILFATDPDGTQIELAGPVKG